MKKRINSGMDKNTIQHTEGSFQNQKGLKIHFQSWEPQGEPRAIFVVVHGHGEHSGRYQDLVNYFVPKGIAAFALDHQGHGKSEGKRGCVSHFADYVQDLHQFRLLVENRFDNLSLFIAGQSMGGLIAFKYLLDNGKGIAAGILSSPEFELVLKVPTVRLWLGKLFSHIAPNVTMSNHLDASYMSRDPVEVQKYKNDPLNHDRISGRLFVEMLATMTESKSRAAEMNTPLLLIYGGKDKIVSGIASKNLIEGVNTRDKKIIEYPDSYHELYHEIDKDKVFDDINAWLEPRL